MNLARGMNGDRRYLLFTLVTLALLISSTQGSMVSVALPDMIRDLHAPLRWVGWVITVYSLAQGISMPIVGKLSDELGRRSVFIGGIALFGLASLGAALVPNVYVLIVLRAVQGLAGGSLLPSAYGVIGDAFVEERARAIGMISSIFPIGSIIGPMLGGLIVEHWGWRWTFLVNVPSVVLLIVATLMVMPSGAREERHRIDVAGALTMSVGMLGVVYALTELSQTKIAPNMAVVVVAIVLGLVGLATFLWREMTTADPLVDIRLLRQREFALTNALNFFYGASIFGLFSFIPLYAETAYRMSSSASGALLTPRAVAMIVASTLSAYLLPRTGYRKPIIAGLVLMALAVLLLSRGLHDPRIGGIAVPNFAYLAGIVGVTGLAFGIAGPAANNAAIELVPDRIAAITGLRGMFRSLGGTLGTALIILVASRAPTEARGLEEAFLGVAISTLLTVVFVFGVPDRVGVGGAHRGGLAAEELPAVVASRRR